MWILRPSIVPIETLRHEVTAAALMMEPAFRHGYAGRARHAGIREFDLAEILQGRPVPLSLLSETPSNLRSQCSKPSSASS